MLDIYVWAQSIINTVINQFNETNDHKSTSLIKNDNAMRYTVKMDNQP